MLLTPGDNNTELEIACKTPGALGFNVEVLFKRDSLIGRALPGDSKKQVFHNVSEVHWLYLAPGGEQRVAIESDAHGTGGTYALDDLLYVMVDAATTRSECF